LFAVPVLQPWVKFMFSTVLDTLWPSPLYVLVEAVPPDVDFIRHVPVRVGNPQRIVIAWRQAVDNRRIPAGKLYAVAAKKAAGRQQARYGITGTGPDDVDLEPARTCRSLRASRLRSSPPGKTPAGISLPASKLPEIDVQVISGQFLSRRPPSIHALRLLAGVRCAGEHLFAQLGVVVADALLLGVVIIVVEQRVNRHAVVH